MWFLMCTKRIQLRMLSPSGDQNSHLVQIVPTCPIKQWDQLLSSGDFKNNVVILFLLQQWKETKNMPGDKIIYVTSGVNAFKLTTNLRMCL